MSNDFSGIDEAKLQQAVFVLKEILGDKEAAKIEKMFGNKEAPNLKLSENDLLLVKTVIEKPELLKKMLSTPQAREGFIKFLGNL